MIQVTVEFIIRPGAEDEFATNAQVGVEQATEAPNYPSGQPIHSDGSLRR